MLASVSGLLRVAYSTHLYTLDDLYDLFRLESLEHTRDDRLVQVGTRLEHLGPDA